MPLLRVDGAGGGQLFRGKMIRPGDHSRPKAAMDKSNPAVDQLADVNIRVHMNGAGQLVNRMGLRVAHQLPRMRSPATSAARLGTGPRADCKTTP